MTPEQVIELCRRADLNFTVRWQQGTGMLFQDFPKMARLSRDIIVTEKIDGTNAQVYIGEDGR